MSKFGTLPARWPGLSGEPDRAAMPANETMWPRVPEPAPKRAAVDLDSELFLPAAAQLGGQNEHVRRLVIEAEQRLIQLDSVKSAIAGMIEPVGRTLKSLETAEAERLTLQGTLAEAREALALTGDGLAASEKKARSSEAENARAAALLDSAQKTIRALEAVRRDQAEELAQRNTELATLQRTTLHLKPELEAVRAERAAQSDQLAQSQRRLLTLDAELQTTLQRLALAEHERTEARSKLDHASAEVARLTKLGRTGEQVWSAAKPRITQLEGALAGADSERSRLRRALDQANQNHRDEIGALQTRFEALSARVALSDSMLEEMRGAVSAGAADVQAADRRTAEIRLARDMLQARLDQIEAALAQRDTRIAMLEQAAGEARRRNETLEATLAIRGDADARVRDQRAAHAARVATLEARLDEQARTANARTAELNDQIRRERLERSMAEGALDAGRSDMARLFRELAALKDGAGSDAPSPPTQQQSAGTPARVRSAA